jgi:hypothetical protein
MITLILVGGTQFRSETARESLEDGKEFVASFEGMFASVHESRQKNLEPSRESRDSQHHYESATLLCELVMS